MIGKAGLGSCFQLPQILTLRRHAVATDKKLVRECDDLAFAFRLQRFYADHLGGNSGACASRNAFNSDLVSAGPTIRIAPAPAKCAAMSRKNAGLSRS